MNCSMDYVKSTGLEACLGKLFKQPAGVKIGGGTTFHQDKAVIDALPSDRVDVADIRDLFGQEGIMLLTAFLTIPFMIPISIPGASTVFGAVILLVGFSRLCGRNLWLPKRIGQRRIPADKLRACLHQGLIFFQRLERLARPYRLKWFISNGIPEP